MDRSANCLNGKPHDWGGWQPVAMVDLDSLIPPGELPPDRWVTLATHHCGCCKASEMLRVLGANFDFLFTGPVAADG